MPAMDYSLVAELYDRYVKVDFDIPFFSEEAKRAAGPVLELMVGTGRVSIPLLQAGVDLTCVDSSAAMLAVLRRKAESLGLTPSIVEMDVCDLHLDRLYRLALLPFNAFAEIQSAADQSRALASIASCLADDGLLILTLHNPAVRLQRVDGQLHLWGGYPLADDGSRLLLWGLESYDPHSHLVSGYQFYETYDPKGTMTQKRLVDLRYRIVFKEEAEALFRQQGFKINAMYGDYSRGDFQADSSPFMIWLLQKSPRV
jgi:SAM-dependent methyltransferase